MPRTPQPCVLIDPTARSVHDALYVDHTDIARLVANGGAFCIGRTWEGGDVLYVDDDGLAKGGGWWSIEGLAQPLRGPGLIVGREAFDADGEYAGTEPPTHSAADVAAQVRFLSDEQVRAWGRAHASEPALMVIPMDGTPPTVIKRFGTLMGGERPEDTVKVQVPIGGTKKPHRGLVYAQGRRLAREQELPAHVFDALGGDPKGYFRAAFDDTTDTWEIAERINPQPW